MSDGSDAAGIEAARSQQEQDQAGLYRDAVEAMATGVVIQNASGEIVASNPAAERVLGLTADDLRRRTSVDPRWRTLREDMSPLRGEDHPAMQTLRSGEPVLGFVMAVHTPDDQLRWLQVDSIPLHDGAGALSGVVAFFADVTAQRAMAAQLVQAEERLSLLREAGGVGLWEWDVRTNEMWHDEGITSILGAPVTSLQDWLAVIHVEDRPQAAADMAAVGIASLGSAPTDMSYRVVAADGAERFVLDRAVVVERDGAVPTKVIGSTVDTTELHRANEQAQHHLDNMTDAYFVVGRDWRFVYVNKQAELVLRHTRKEMVGHRIWDVFADAVGSMSQAQYERAMDGEHVEFDTYYEGLEGWYEVRAHPVRNGIAVYFRDVTARHRATEERDGLLRSAQQAKEDLAHAASHDPLTDLPNRAMLALWLEDHLAGPRAGQRVGVLFVDLDRFKLVNDTHGHAEGDVLLVEAARRLRRLAPEDALVARLGGDEFVVALAGATTTMSTFLARRLLTEFQEPFAVGDRHLVVTASIGVAFGIAGDGSTPITLLRDADAALYQAKDGGRNRLGVFDDNVREKVVARLRTEVDLREALLHGQLSAHYQPIFDAATGRPVGVEALARWHHPTRGMVPPDEFIPVAEETGLILPIGEFMLDRAIEDGPALELALGVDGLTVWVNVSDRQLDEPGFAEQVLSRAANTGGRHRLGLEITERVLAIDAATSEASLRKIASGGVKIAVDDFGTGYSSLARLSLYPVQVLKIDRSFIAELTTETGRPLVAAIIDLAHAVGATACAEGVETAEQLTILRQLGVDNVSGYHLARPDTIAALAAKCH